MSGSVSGTVGNADRWRAVFTDPDGDPVNPDEGVPISFVVYNARNEILPGGAAQNLIDRIETGTFEFLYTPPVSGIYKVKVAALVRGIPQVSPAIPRRVYP